MLSDIEVLRLEHGDTDCDYPILTDEEYQYFLSTYPNKKKRAKLIDLAILNALSYDVRERSGQEERYANQAFQNRRELVAMKYKDPTFNGQDVVPIFGGTSRSEMACIASDPDRVPDYFYKDEYRGRGVWQDGRKFFYVGRAKEPYHCKWYPYLNTYAVENVSVG